MSVSTDDLQEPVGELDLALLFPDKTTTQAEDDLQTWIDIAVTQAAAAGVVDADTLDRGTRAYAYYRAYKSIYQRLSASPISANVQDAGVSSSMSQGQINSFLQKYIDWERVWSQVLTSVVTMDVVLPATIPVKTQVGW
jgi:hypothetical protein